ncbi:MAG: DegV family protein, partial [Firmicutes bacterium]|nr:DegV family protein [Bacillota bacterium]
MESKIAIVTDSNSGITQDQARELGVYVIPMPFDIGGTTYFEDINLTQEQFYEKLAEDVEIHTSQPTPDAVMTLWEQLLENYDELVYM